MINLVRNSVVIFALLFSMHAAAISLQQAKSEGLVGEQATGYLGIVGSPTPELEALVKDINSKRRSAYQRIAEKNGTELDAVEKLAGQKAIGKTESGQYVKQGASAWQKVP